MVAMFPTAALLVAAGIGIGTARAGSTDSWAEEGPGSSFDYLQDQGNGTGFRGMGGNGGGQ